MRFHQIACCRIKYLCLKLIVVAKGEDELALYIRTLAREQEIPMVENRPLARSLYYQVEEDETIPEDLYVAVIEVMRYLIQTNELEV